MRHSSDPSESMFLYFEGDSNLFRAKSLKLGEKAFSLRALNVIRVVN